MKNTNITIQPAIINRETVQAMLGGISRTTFWRKRRYWEQKGTPFPSPAPGTNPGKGGAVSLLRCYALLRLAGAC